MVPRAPPLEVDRGDATDSACGSTGPPKGINQGFVGFFLTEGTGWGAKPILLTRVPSTFRLSPVFPVVTRLYLVVT